MRRKGSGLKPASEGQVLPDTCWKKGQSGNPNGRPLGSKNKMSKVVKTEAFNTLIACIDPLLEKYFDSENFSVDIEAMGPRDRANCMLSYVKWRHPQIKQIEKSFKG